MRDVYEYCPSFENDKYLLRLISEEDTSDLLKVYSDDKAVPFFNGDNCNGDDFYYKTLERMEQAVDFWIFSYKERYFVRWSIVDKDTKEVVGTIELFHRDADAHFYECGLLRLDLRSDYENASEIENIIKLIAMTTFDLFYCDKIATKAISEATERRNALYNLGFSVADKKIVGNDGTVYGDYFILEKDNV
ncbi:MAG: N-acetyltransferase [Lachnospiraceae bacterium]|nr:N-acetyltransferase [Lachnospiraceae bacterium]